MSLTPGAISRSRTISAAILMSSSLPFAQEPMKAWCILVPLTPETGFTLWGILSSSGALGAEIRFRLRRIQGECAVAFDACREKA